MGKTLKYFKPYIPMMMLIIALLFGQAMCELALPGYMSDIINKGIVAGDLNHIYKVGAIMIAIAFGSVVFAVLGS
ncbi:MAG: ABC transporter ATP-binding protein, partial [Anaerovoracaceae bacterium]